MIHAMIAIHFHLYGTQLHGGCIARGIAGSNDWPIDTSLMQADGTRAYAFLGRCKCRHDSFYIGQIHGSEVDVSHLIVEYYKLSAFMISHRCPVDVSGLVWINDRPGQIDNILPSQGFGTS